MILKQGDVLTTNLEAIAHGVNCIGAFGAGVAGAIRKKHPSVYERYITKHQTEGWSLADIQPCRDNGKIIYNCATQKLCGADYRHVNYEALYRCLMAVGSLEKEIAIPLIGCGLAGGSKRILLSMVETVEEIHDCSFEVWEL